METSLNRLRPGESGVVRTVRGTGAKARIRLLEMGLIRGTAVEMVRYAPMGDPIEVKLKGYRLSLRKVEAESVIVDKG